MNPSKKSVCIAIGLAGAAFLGGAVAVLMMGVLFLWTTFAAYLNFASYIMSITPMPITP